MWQNLLQCPAYNLFRQLEGALDLAMIDSPSANHTIYFDFIGPVQVGKHGSRFICIVVDSFTKFGDAIASQRCTVKVALRLLKKWITNLRAPERVLSDNCSAFISHVFTNYCRKHLIDNIYCPPYSHKSNGTIEVFKKTLANHIRKVWYNKGGDWTNHISYCLFTINTSVHLTTKSTPFFLLSGRTRTRSSLEPAQLNQARKLA